MNDIDERVEETPDIAVTADDASDQGESESTDTAHNQEPVEDISSEFETSVVAATTNPFDKGTILSGTRLEDETEEEAAERKKRAKIAEEDLKKASDAEAESAGLDANKNSTPEDEAPNQGGFNETTLQKIYRNVYLNVSDKGNYLAINSASRKGRLDMKTLEKQVEAAVLTGALKKGWKELYFFNKGNNQIDPTLSGLAQKVIAKHSQPGRSLHGMDIKVSYDKNKYMQSLMQEGDKKMPLEPWRANTMLTRPFRDAVLAVDGMKAGARQMAAAVPNAVGGWMDRNVWNGGLSFSFREKATEDSDKNKDKPEATVGGRAETKKKEDSSHRPGLL
jgi:hypothetical protein